jgi:hypothetical protein
VDLRFRPTLAGQSLNEKPNLKPEGKGNAAYANNSAPPTSDILGEEVDRDFNENRKNDHSSIQLYIDLSFGQISLKAQWRISKKNAEMQ